MAWLHATPKPPEGSKRAKAAEQKKMLSRLDQMKKDKIPVRMPPNPSPVLIARLIELGITGTSGMGPVPLSWQEIEAWERVTAVRIPPWEARLLRQLSLDYIAEGRKAESENCPAPWRAEVTQRERDLEEQELRMVLG